VKNPEQRDLSSRAGEREPPAGADGQHRDRHRAPHKAEREADPPGALERDDQPAGDRDRGDRERAADPDRRLHPVHDRHQRAGEAAEGEPRPRVRAALLWERRAELSDHQPRRHEEQRGGDDQPGQGLDTAPSNRAEGVEHDDAGHQQADGVEPPKLAARRGPLSAGARGARAHPRCQGWLS
jgi:hypothetical protein